MARIRLLALAAALIGVLAAAPLAGAQADDSAWPQVIDAGAAWLAGADPAIDTAVSSEIVSSFGNEPAIAPGEILLEGVFVTSTPVGQAPPPLPDLLQALGAPACGQPAPPVTTLCSDGWDEGWITEGPAFPLLLVGGHYEGPLSNPTDHLIEIGFELLDTNAGPPYVPDSQFPNDYLQDLNLMFPFQQVDGTWMFDGVLDFGGPEVAQRPAPILTIINDGSFLTLMPQPPGATSIRVYGFKTSLADPYQPNTVVASIYPSLADGPLDLADTPSIFDLLESEETTTTTTTTAVSVALVDDAGDDDDGAGGSSPLAIGAIGLGVVALGAGALLRFGRPSTLLDVGGAAAAPPADATPTPGTTTTVDERDALGGILEAFLAMGAPPASGLTDDQATTAWMAARHAWRVEQQEVVDDLAGVLGSFNPAWADAMAALDRYREQHAFLSSASIEVQAMLTTWREERAIYQSADLAFGLATLVIGGAGIVRQGWRSLMSMRAPARLAAGHTKPGAMLAGLVEEDVIRALAHELGENVDDVVNRFGWGGAAEHLFNLAFQRRGWHYLPKIGQGVAMEKGLVDVLVAMGRSGSALDLADVVGRLVANIRAALGAAARRGRLTSQPWSGATAGGLTGPLAQLLGDDLRILQEIIKTEPRFLESLRTAVVDTVGQEIKETVWKDGVKTIKTTIVPMTVKLLSDADFDLLVKFLDAGGDVAKMAAPSRLGPASVAVLQHADALSPFVAAMGGANLTSNLVETLVGTGAGSSDAPAFDVAGYADEIGLHTGGFWGLMGMTLWGAFTSPSETFGQVSTGVATSAAVNDLLEQHGDRFVDMADALHDAVGALDAARGALGGGAGLPGLREELHDLERTIGDLERAMDATPAGAPGRADRQRELDAIKAEVAAKVAQVRAVIEQLAAIADAMATMRDALAGLADGASVTTLDPAVLAKVNAARGLLLGMMATLQASSMPGTALPPGWGFGPQVASEIRAWHESQAAPAPTAIPTAPVPAPPAKGSGSGPGWGPAGTPWEGMHWSDDGSQAWRDGLTDEQVDDWQDWQDDAERAERRAFVESATRD